MQKLLQSILPFESPRNFEDENTHLRYIEWDKPVDEKFLEKEGLTDKVDIIKKKKAGQVYFYLARIT